MITARESEEARGWADRIRRAGLSLGLVPTLGALHAGHRRLIERARAECDRVAVSVFVNPTQFGPKEDLARYPRTVNEDLELCRAAGADLVFLPESGGAGGIYPDGFQSWVELTEISRPLCGEKRPGHFRGVATVVAILLGIFRPNRAYFGLKDYQQARLIERMASDLRLGAVIVLEPTVREADGLALSSRNRFLSSEERRRALAIPRALRAAEAAWRAGEVRGAALEGAARAHLGAESGLRLDYLTILDARSLLPLAEGRVDRAPEGAVLAVAAFAGSTRLIDNVWLRPGMPSGEG